MNVATIPPGGVAGAHIHVDFEVMLYILEGRVRHEYGDGLKERVDHEAGDFIFIAPGVPHEVFNLSDTEPSSRSSRDRARTNGTTSFPMRVLLLLAEARSWARFCPGPATYRAEIEKYRRERIAELTAPNGWLAVRGLFWLHEGENTAGSDPSSEIRLPPRAPKRLGVFTLKTAR